MTYSDSNVVYALNSYLWKLLEANLGWSKSSYNGMSPITPSQQQPELMQTGKPFIVYGSASQPASHLYDFEVETVAYNIYAPSATEANKIANLIKDVFKRQDLAAADVNKWLDFEGDPSRRGTHRRISFASIKANVIEKVEPSDEEGGYVNAVAIVEVRYVNNNNEDIQTVFSTYP